MNAIFMTPPATATSGGTSKVTPTANAGQDLFALMVQGNGAAARLSNTTAQRAMMPGLEAPVPTPEGQTDAVMPFFSAHVGLGEGVQDADGVLAPALNDVANVQAEPVADVAAVLGVDGATALSVGQEGQPVPVIVAAEAPVPTAVPVLGIPLPVAEGQQQILPHVLTGTPTVPETARVGAQAVDAKAVVAAPVPTVTASTSEGQVQGNTPPANRPVMAQSAQPALAQTATSDGAVSTPDAKSAAAPVTTVTAPVNVVQQTTATPTQLTTTANAVPAEAVKAAVSTAAVPAAVVAQTSAAVARGIEKPMARGTPAPPGPVQQTADASPAKPNVQVAHLKATAAQPNVPQTGAVAPAIVNTLAPPGAVQPVQQAQIAPTQAPVTPLAATGTVQPVVEDIAVPAPLALAQTTTDEAPQQAALSAPTAVKETAPQVQQGLTPQAVQATPNSAAAQPVVNQIATSVIASTSVAPVDTNPKAQAPAQPSETRLKATSTVASLAPQSIAAPKLDVNAQNPVTVEAASVGQTAPVRNAPLAEVFQQPTFLSVQAKQANAVAQPATVVQDSFDLGEIPQRSEPLVSVSAEAHTTSNKVSTAPDLTPKTPTRPFADALIGQVKSVEVSEGRTTINLHPRGLGNIEVEVIAEKDAASKVVVRVENPAVLQALRDDRVVLAQAIGVADSEILEFKESNTGEQSDNSGGQEGGSNDLFSSSESDSVTNSHVDVLGNGNLDIVT